MENTGTFQEKEWKSISLFRSNYKYKRKKGLMANELIKPLPLTWMFQILLLITRNYWELYIF